jgi:hypothetical protein
MQVGSDPVGELRPVLEAWADAFAAGCRRRPARTGDADRTGALSVGRRGLEVDEAGAFLRSWKSGLVRVLDDGTFTVPDARACPPALHIVGRGRSGVVLHTEYLIQIGALAELVDDHGWSIGDLAFEQGEWDLLGYDGDRVTLAVEAKARAHRPHQDSLESLSDSFLARSTDGDAPCPANHDRKWRALERWVADCPVDVLLTASGARWWFRAHDEHERMQLDVVQEADARG